MGDQMLAGNSEVLEGPRTSARRNKMWNKLWNKMTEVEDSIYTHNIQTANGFKTHCQCLSYLFTFM